jgi:hypothetical protein
MCAAAQRGMELRYILGPPAIVAFIAALTALAVVIMGLRRRAIPGGTEFSLMMCAVFVWALTSGLGSAATGVDRKVFFAVLGYAGSTTLALAATNRWHGLIWTSFTPGPVSGSNVLIFGHGPWFFVAVAYYAVLGFVAATIIGRPHGRHSGYLSGRQ